MTPVKATNTITAITKRSILLTVEDRRLKEDRGLSCGIAMPYYVQIEGTYAPVDAKRDYLASFAGSTDLHEGCDFCTNGIHPADLRKRLISSLEHDCEKGECLVRNLDNAIRDRDKPEEYVQDLHDMMKKSKFCMVPRGDSAATKRFFSSIAAGCIPVIVSDHLPLPFSTVIDYSMLSIRIPEARMMSEKFSLAAHLRELGRDTVKSMQSELECARRALFFSHGCPYPWNKTKSSGSGSSKSETKSWGAGKSSASSSASKQASSKSAGSSKTSAGGSSGSAGAGGGSKSPSKSSTASASSSSKQLRAAKARRLAEASGTSTQGQDRRRSQTHTRTSDSEKTPTGTTSKTHTASGSASSKDHHHSETHKSPAGTKSIRGSTGAGTAPTSSASSAGEHSASTQTKPRRKGEWQLPTVTTKAAQCRQHSNGSPDVIDAMMASIILNLQHHKLVPGELGAKMPLSDICE
mmetsp:Transcript_3025/g.6737  ORF Transcript_3025/g.6737 Transcript_3025/m.6737 type:complete len:465 (+) Transcript_3025:35-1429(+)